MLLTAVVLIVALGNIVTGIIVLLKNRGNFTNVAFAIATFILAAWLILSHFSNDIKLGYDTVLLLRRLRLFLAPMGLYFLLLFCLEYTRISYKYFRPFAIIFGFTSLGISILGTTPMAISGVKILDNKVESQYGQLMSIVFVFLMAVFVAIVTVLLRFTRQSQGTTRARAKIMTISLFVSLLLVFVTNLILPVIFHQYNYTSLGLLGNVILFGGFAYAIVVHRLFDIRAVVARSVTYFMLIATMGAIYAFITFNASHIIFSDSKLSASQQTLNIFAALVLAFTFQPLQLLITKITDSIFFRDFYDPEELLKEVSHILATEIGLVELSSKMRSLLMRRLKVDNVDIIVLNNDQVFTESGHYVVSRLEELAKDFGSLRSHIIVSDEDEPEGHRKAILQKYGVSVFAMLNTKKEKRIGYLLLGPKLSGDIFTNTELKVISSVADQLAIAIQNAKAYVEIQRFNQTLRSKVTVATQKLREANQNLQQIDVIKDDFLSMASHQLQTPMTVVEGYISNILDGLYGDLNQEQREAIELTQTRVRLTRALVVDLLNISRMEAGRFFIDLNPSDINKAIEEEIALLKLVAKEHGTKIIYNRPDQPVPKAMLDDQKIRQVIMNLIDNAITYSPGGKVTISLESTNNQIEFTVEDTGIGVPKAQQRNLFTKFFRAENAKRTRPNGTGIGLFLVKQVVEAHNGHIIFISDGKQGSIFGFSIPLVKDESRASKAELIESVKSN